MSKKKIYLITFLIVALSFLAGNLVYPRFLKIPRLPDIPFKLGLDLQGGIHLVYEADLSNIQKEDVNSSMQGLRDVIERRVNIFGVKEPSVQVQNNRLIVELAGVRDPVQAIEMIGQTPFLEFKEQKENYQEIIEKNQKIEETKEGEEFEDPFQSTNLTGQYLKKAELVFDETTSRPLVSLQFNDDGAKLFEEITSRNVGKFLPIYIDGLPISVPVVQDVISGGRAQITGNFNIETARALARNLNAGALPVPIKLISQQSVGPTLGEISLNKSLKAGTLGFLSIVLFLILFYRLPGILASLSLAIYVVLILLIFKLIPITLTLAGIGGFILSIGMAVDGNVLVFSRMKEEQKLGKTLGQAIEEGFRRAWPSIRDGNLTTLIVAAIFFGLGSSFIQGFALTLILGVLMSMFSTITITKTFLKCFIQTRLEKNKWLW